MASQLSPVKKRVKENTPPEVVRHTIQQHHRQHTQSPLASRKPTIVIADTPSPAISVITISSDSEDEPLATPSG